MIDFSFWILGFTASYLEHNVPKGIFTHIYIDGDNDCTVVGLITLKGRGDRSIVTIFGPARTLPPHTVCLKNLRFWHHKQNNGFWVLQEAVWATSSPKVLFGLRNYITVPKYLLGSTTFKAKNDIINGKHSFLQLPKSFPSNNGRIYLTNEKEWTIRKNPRNNPWRFSLRQWKNVWILYSI